LAPRGLLAVLAVAVWISTGTARLDEGADVPRDPLGRGPSGRGPDIGDRTKEGPFGSS